MSRTGKIARLPRSLQDELNQRLEDNVPGRELLTWLNALPEVQTILHDHFGGDPVNEQNLSNWRAGGFAEWQCRQDFLNELRAFSTDAAQLEAALSPMAGHAARLLSLQFALTLAKGESTGLDLKRVEAQKPLFAMARAVTALRHLEQRDAVIRQWEQNRACTCSRPRPFSAPATSPPQKPPAPPAVPYSATGPPASHSRGRHHSRPCRIRPVGPVWPVHPLRHSLRPSSTLPGLLSPRAFNPHQGKSKLSPQPQAHLRRPGSVFRSTGHHRLFLLQGPLTAPRRC